MNKKVLMGLCTAIGTVLMLEGCTETPSAPEAPQQTSQATPVAETKTCMSDYSTGSHYNRTVECITDQERDQEEQQTKDQLDLFRHMQSQTSAH